MLKDVVNNFVDFMASVTYTEIGVIQKLFRNSINSLMAENPELIVSMFLKYPFTVSYAEWCLQDSDITNEAEAFNDAWIKAHEDEDISNVQLPLYTKEYTFSKFWKHRIAAYINNSISREFFEEYAEDRVIINQERNGFGIIKPESYILFQPANPKIPVIWDFPTNAFLITPGETSLFLGTIDADYRYIENALRVKKIVNKLHDPAYTTIYFDHWTEW